MDGADRQPGAPTRPNSDKLTQHETFLLYALMESRCAKCKTLVVRESGISGKAFNLGKRAHMVGRSEAGPRGSAGVSVRDRGDVRNHLLLCGTCHDEIDRDVGAWPLERLRQLREEHLAWVTERDERAQVARGRLVYAKAIDAACELVWLDAWSAWTRYMLHPYLSWRPAQVDAVGDLVRLVSTTDWPGELAALEIALARFAYLLGEAAATFSERADLRDGGDLHVIRHYKRGWNTNYHRDHEAFVEWLEYYEGLVFEATKAGDWIRSAWRAAGNRDFIDGERVHLITGPHEDSRDHIVVLEYTEDEKRELLDAGRAGVRAVPTLRLKLGERSSDLERVVREILTDELERDPAPDVVAGLAARLRELDGVASSATLFEGLPGRLPSAERMKRVSHALVQEGILRRNPEGRGFVRGQLPG